MSTIQHKNLTGNQLHEPKGVSSALVNTFNTCSSGAGLWLGTHYQEIENITNFGSAVYVGLSGVHTIILNLDDVITSVSTNILFQVSDDNGSTYNSTAIYLAAYNQDGTSYGSGGYSGIPLAPDNSSVYQSGQVIITNFNKPYISTVKGHTASNTGTDFSGSQSSASIVGLINSATAWNACRIIPVTGLLVSGTATLQAIRS